MPNIPNESKKVGAEFLKKWVLKDIPSLGPDAKVYVTGISPKVKRDLKIH